MSSQQRPINRRGRGASGAWNRLRTASVDPLEEYGLPSKGEKKLNDFKAQENFYNKIVDRYMRFCADSGGGRELDKQFAALSLSHNSGSGTGIGLNSNGSHATGRTTAPISKSLSGSRWATPTQPSERTASAATNTTTTTTSSTSSTTKPAPRDPTTELTLILSAMRKLREAIVATHRLDTFAQRAYLFILQAGILAKHMETYHPALLHLLHHIHPHTPLSAPELHDCVGYRLLDLACRQGDLAAARAAQVAFAYRGRRVELVLRALARDDWVLFWKMRRAVDGYQKKLMEWAEDGVRLQALKCLGKSYMQADRAYVERCADATWEALVASGVGWELESNGEVVVIRRPKSRVPPPGTAVTKD